MEVYLQSCSFLVDDIRREPYSEMKRSGIELPHGNASGQFGESQTLRKSEAFSKWLGRQPDTAWQIYGKFLVHLSAVFLHEKDYDG